MADLGNAILMNLSAHNCEPSEHVGAQTVTLELHAFHSALPQTCGWNLDTSVRRIIRRLVYERLSETPETLYGAEIGSHYQGQGLKLSKHFRKG